MKLISTIFTILIFVGLPATNAHAEEVVNKYLFERDSITGIYYDPTPLPDFPGGLFRFIATVKNTSSDEQQVASLAFRVRQLTNGNTLFNGDNGRYGRLTSQITAGGVFEWKPGDGLGLSGQHMVEAPALIQSNLPPGGNGNFEVVYRDGNDQLRHLFRRNDVDGFSWVKGNDGKAFAYDVNSAPGLIQSNLPEGGLGNFEVVYRDSNGRLRHWFRMNDVEGLPWREGNDGEPLPFAYDVKSAPALIQSNLPQGGVGNFEVVYRDSNDELRHLYRRNDVEGFPWVEGNGGKAFAYDVKSAPALIQNRRNGNLEVVYRDSNNQLRHWYRDSNSVWHPGNNGVPLPVGDDVTSAPALIQSNLGSQGDNFEVVVRKSDNKLHHYFRQRNPEDQTVFEWKPGGEPFAGNVDSAPALIQSNLGAAGGNFEVVVNNEGDLYYYFRTKKGEVILEPGKEVSTQFVIGLVDKNPKKFQLFVDAVGIPVPESTTIVYLDEEDASFDKNDPKNNGFNYRVTHEARETSRDLAFIIKKGLYRNQSVILDPDMIPEQGGRTISFIGEDGAIMSGAEDLTKYTWDLDDKTKNCWSTYYRPEKPSLIHPGDLYNCNPFCQGITCKVREDLYLNNTIMEQVEHNKPLVPGQWKFDKHRDNRFNPDLELTCENYGTLAQDEEDIPSMIHACFKHDDDDFDIDKQLVEISRTRVAFGGSDKDDETDHLVTNPSIPDVAIKNLIVEKYATPIQFGTIGYQKVGDRWTVENNEVRKNHSAGIAFGSDADVLGNYVHDNLLIGVKTGFQFKENIKLGNIELGEDGREVPPPFESAEVSQNVIESNSRPDLGVILTWESGGTKFSGTEGLMLDRNWVVDNQGPGLWADINNCDMTYFCNSIEGNNGSGIFHEISYKADIVGNVVRKNGFTVFRDEPYKASQIQISTSRDATVYGNWVESDVPKGNGIVVAAEFRGGNPVDYCLQDQSDDYYYPDKDKTGYYAFYTGNSVEKNEIIQNEPGNKKSGINGFLGANVLEEKWVRERREPKDDVVGAVKGGAQFKNNTYYLVGNQSQNGNERKWMKGTWIRFNVGGSKYSDKEALEWVKYKNCENIADFSAAIGGTEDDQLYQSECWGENAFQFSVLEGKYTVKLHFAENKFNKEDARVFDVLVHGKSDTSKVELNNLDIFSEVGANTKLVKAITIADLTDQITIELKRGSADEPTLSAIEIKPATSFEEFSKIFPEENESEQTTQPPPPVDCLLDTDGHAKYPDLTDEKYHSQTVVGCLIAQDNENYLANADDAVSIKSTGTACNGNAKLTLHDVNGGELMHGDTVFIQTNNGYWWSTSGAVLHISSTLSNDYNMNTSERFQVHKVNEGSAIIDDYDSIALKTYGGRWVEQAGDDIVITVEDTEQADPTIENKFTYVGWR